MIDLESRIQALESQMVNLVRVCRVSSSESGGRARVIIEDGSGGETVTGPLPVLYPRTHTERDAWTLRAGEHVVCVFLPYGRETGFILGAYYPGGSGPGETADRIVDGERLILRSDDVRIGGVEAVERLVYGDTWAAWVDSVLRTHTHSYMPGPGPAVLTAPSGELAAPPPAYLSSQARTR